MSKDIGGIRMKKIKAISTCDLYMLRNKRKYDVVVDQLLPNEELYIVGHTNVDYVVSHNANGQGQYVARHIDRDVMYEIIES